MKTQSIAVQLTNESWLIISKVDEQIKQIFPLSFPFTLDFVTHIVSPHLHNNNFDNSNSLHK